MSPGLPVRATGVLAAAAVAALLLTSVLDRPPARDLVVTPAPYVEQLPAAPDPFPGGDGACTVPDPTGTGGCVTAATSWLLTELGSAFGELRVSCWSEHAWNPASAHPDGRACDVFPGRSGVVPESEEAAAGWHVAEWARENAAALEVEHVIWWGRIWSRARPAAGWAPYRGGGVYDVSDPTGGHYDHVHISVREDA
ncbi:hypothetical protein PU560_07155 [Georgenia sp. 10Sc9-8]|uniref:ARB-07466-like C-terminal domain-containing protein n=1 Tax=Georgenia halotolerans TaxID=3028317 RepID=A0ABT5TWB2_9MICO|nr:hypothetical protein [Georgenia halotolerans]